MRLRRLLPILALLVILLASAVVSADSATITTCRTHTWSEWMPEPQFPTCTEPGGRVRFCTVCGTSEYERLPAQGHNMEQWNKKDPTCKDAGYVEYKCTRCGKTEREMIPATGKHKYGPWGMDEPATCKERELQKCVCKVCGDKLWRYVGELGDHTWQETGRVAPTCGAEGRVTYVCKVCGATKEEAIPATGEHQYGEWRTLREATREEGGEEQRVCAVCGSVDTRTMEPLPYDVENLILSVQQTSEQKELYVPGDQVTFAITLTNGSSFDYGESRVNCAANYSVAPEDNADFCQVASLAQGQQVTDQMIYVIGEDDLARGCVVLPFVGIAYFPDGFTPALPDVNSAEHIPTVSNSETITFVLYTGQNREKKNAALALSVTQTSLEKSVYKLGDTLTFEVELTNVCEYALDDPQIRRYSGMSDLMSEGAAFGGEGSGRLEPGASLKVTDTYTVAEGDVLEGLFSLVWEGEATLDLTSGVPYLDPPVAGNGTAEMQETVRAIPYNLRLACKNPDGFDTVGLILGVTQVSEEKPFYQEGDVLEFQPVVRNVSTVYLSNPQTYCGHLNAGIEVDRCEWWLDIAPGASESGTTTYTVTAEDVARGCFVLEWTGGAALCEADWPNLDPDKYDQGFWVVVPEPVTLAFAASEETPDTPTYEEASLKLMAWITSEVKKTYVVGETISLELHVDNAGTMMLLDPSIDYHAAVGGYEFPGELPPGDGRMTGHEYTITADDESNHCAVLVFDAMAFNRMSAENIGEITNIVRSNTCTIVLPVQGLIEPVITPDPDPGTPKLALTAVAHEPKDSYMMEGDTTEDIIYDLTVQNVGTGPCSLTGIGFIDSGGASAFIEYDSPIELPAQGTFTDSLIWWYLREDVIPGTASEVILGEVEITFTAYGSESASATKGGSLESPPASLRHKLIEEGPTGWVVPPVTRSGSVNVIKRIISVSADAAGYQPGEWIHFEFEVTNNSRDTLTDVELWDSLGIVYPDHGLGMNEYVTSFDSLAPGETKYAYWSYEVKESDVGTAYLSNVGVAGWLDPDSGDRITANSNCVYAYVIPKAPDPVPSRTLPEIIVNKWIENLPANHSYYVPGEIIHYHVQAYNNTGKTMYNVGGFDELAIERPDKQIYSAPELEPYAWTPDMPFDYVVTDYDATVAGEVYNEALVTAEDEFGMVFYFWSNPTLVKAGVDEPEGYVEIVKTETSTPLNDKYYTPGETITYDLTVYNHTKETIYLLDVYDILGDPDILPPYHVFGADKLEPNASLGPIEFTHTVTEDDADNGSVFNIAWLTYNDVEDGPLDPQNITYSNEVFSPTGRDVPDRHKEKKHSDPQPRPNNRLDLKDPQPDSCSFTLLAEGTFATDMKLHFCGKHGEVAKQADELLAQTADKAEAWRQIIDLWTAEVDEMYAELIASARGTAVTTVQKDQAAFDMYLTTLRAQLELIYPNDAATVNSKLARLLRDRCAELCYELNNANVARPDSLRTGSYAELTLTTPPAQCLRTEARMPNADIRFRLSLCDDHGPIEESVCKLMTEARTQGDAVKAGQRAQSKWQQALDAMTNLRYKQASKGDRAVIASNRLTFDQLLESREALLKLVYPSHPEIVAEMMAQIVKDNMMLLCEGWNR